jgi:hypothetical protein
MLSKARRKKNQAGVVRRKYVNRNYELLFTKELNDDLLMVCQDPGLDSEDYLKLKEKTRGVNGEVFKLNNKVGVFSNLFRIFGGGSLCVEWGKFKNIENYKKKADFLDEQGCKILAVLHQNRFHYNSEVIKQWKTSLQKKVNLVRGLNKRLKLFLLLKKKLRLRIYAYISPIEKKSKKAS